MIDPQTICPYTGLRSFTEEESLYFKGRDSQVDQITALLERNKFLMLTGASGEGKSSLIYAGLIPNARAGFFKAKYTNWVVADFRPERNPVANMAKSLAEKFNTEPATVETELRRGFSSLIDLYTNSEFYSDEEDLQWKELPEVDKKNKKRKAANLMILVDQFEEFFTNPENFFNETPSQDSQVVVNLILETARIAIKRNLPVYVVCTMRSDYIGQCSAFRGLPEYIGFSQFFVPRLKRKDLKQVIEEPAILSGNRISQRLIERLVFDISEGVDQLPILQHSLSQIWLAADHGREEMDLLHYAKVGGMPANELPDEDQQKFVAWFKVLPEHQRAYYHDTGLNKVVEIHANLLYETVCEYYNKRYPEKPIAQQATKRIVALTFSCLTKIDNSRAVRNRMSLEEITRIINEPGSTHEVVAEVLSVYREEGNSFIRPFKTEDPSTHGLSPSTVLDITHESLIRNWNKLNTWANQEFEFYSTYLDFKKQLDRWKQSGRSSGYLLPIGALTYFENWYNQCKPNAGWIKRYAAIQLSPEKAVDDANEVLRDIDRFLKDSARKVLVTRAFIRYGPFRIAAAMSIILMLVLSGFYWYNAEQKQNDKVIESVRNQAFELMKSKEVENDFKAEHLLLEERYKSGSLVPYLSGLELKTRLSLAIGTYKRLLLFNKNDSSAVKNDLIELIQNNFSQMFKQGRDHSFLIQELNRFTILLTYDDYYNPSDAHHRLLRELSTEGYNLASVFFSKKEMIQATLPLEINYSIQQWLTFGDVSDDKVNSILGLISPFEGTAAQGSFEVFYPKGSYEINGRSPNDYNGGYHTLASLYAAVGNVEKVILCFERIRESGQNDYFTGSLFNNYTHILGTLYQFGHREKVGPMVSWLGANYPTNVPLTIYRNAVIRSGYMSSLYQVNIQKDILRSYQGYLFPNLYMAKREVFNALAEDYEKIISAIPDASQRNYLLAINKKRRAMFTHKYHFDRRINADMGYLETLLEQAVNHYRLVSKDYLEERVSITIPYYSDGVRTRSYKRKHLFTYPDYMEGWFSNTYHSDLFFNYIDKRNLFTEFYSTSEDLNFIHFWLAKAYEVEPFIGSQTFRNRYPVSDEILVRILKLADTHPAGKTFDRNLIFLMLANRAFEKNDVQSGLKYYDAFDKKNFSASRDKYEYLEKTFFLNQMKELCVNLANTGKYKEATLLAERFEKQHEKAYAYIFMAEKVYMSQTDPMAFVYIDSVFAKSRDVDFSQFNFGANRAIDFRFNLILLLSRIGGIQMNQLSDNFLKEIIEDNKFDGAFCKVYGVAEEGNFYRAFSSIPSTLTESQDLIACDVIIWQASRKKEGEEGRKKWASMDQYLTHDLNYIFYLPN